jgi:hypothetical protein
MSQTTQILEYLEHGHSITPFEAFDLFGSFRLSERIREIQAKGYTIEKGWHETERGARVRRYWLGVK